MESRRPVRNVRTRPATAKEAGDWGIRVSIPRNQSPMYNLFIPLAYRKFGGLGDCP